MFDLTVQLEKESETIYRDVCIKIKEAASEPPLQSVLRLIFKVFKKFIVIFIFMFFIRKKSYFDTFFYKMSCLATYFDPMEQLKMSRASTELDICQSVLEKQGF